MSSKRIKGITIEIGGDTTGLYKALSGVNSEIRDTQSQLKDVERLLKLDPGNTELLRQKYDLLNRSIEQTESKLKTLKDAEKQVQQQFARGEVTEDQYNALKREIIATESSLKDLKSEAKKAENAVKGIDEKPIEEVAAAAGKAEDALGDAGKEASNFGDYLKASAIVEGAKGLVDAMGNVVDESKEYLKIMGSLETSSERAGYSTEETAQIYKKLYGVLGDQQTAATTTANLQALGLTQEDLIKATNTAIGAWSTYGDSIPIDGLAEAINETAKTGRVTGVLADALNWAGVSEDDFNARLEKTQDASDRANMILQQLTDQGLEDAGKAWRENNEALVENNEANADLQEQMAALGEKALPVITSITDAIAKALGWFNSLDESTQRVILTVIALTAAIGPATSAYSTFSSVIGFFTNPANAAIISIGAIVAAVVAMVTLIAVKGDEIQAVLQKVDDFLQGIFLTDWTQIFGPGLGNALNVFFSGFKNIWDSTKRLLDGIIDFIRGIFTGDWERAWKGISNIFGGIFDGLVAIAKAPLNAIIALVNGLINGVNWAIDKINSISVDIPDWLGGGHIGFDLSRISSIPYLAKGGILSQGSAVVGEAGPELLTLSGGKAIVQPLTNQTTNNSTNTGGISITVYGAPGQDVNELAEIISEKISDAAERKGVVFT